MHVETQGAGPDLVMIHGWAMHAGIFAGFARALAPHFRLHLVDLPGHGYSRADAGSLDPAECAGRIAEQVPRAIWLGWSLGGLVAMRAALDAPSSVRGLVLISSSPRFVVGNDWTHGVAPSVFAEFGAGLADDYRGTIERFLALETLGAEHARSELRALKADVFAHGEPAMSALTDGLRVLDATDLRADMSRIRVPSLWIAGRRDRLVDPDAMKWAAERSGGRYVECNSGHAPFLGHAEVLAETIEQFAAELAP
ncbi:MAG TPA: pimeloyl-ACP methyl ester esterase BioH [Rhodanobacteraceae bacterium]|nr:pimeloyl-ACP methyl ester esterase BioH [Rhodanobacteraceae bacterium]